MTTITIRIPDEGAVRLLEESIKAGVSPDRFVAMLIEERLKHPSPMPDTLPQPAPRPSEAIEPPAVPELNPAGLKALERLFKNFGPPGAASDTDEAEPKPRKVRKAPKKKSRRAR
jgi:hypothetical protein